MMSEEDIVGDLGELIWKQHRKQIEKELRKYVRSKDCDIRSEVGGIVAGEFLTNLGVHISYEASIYHSTRLQMNDVPDENDIEMHT